MFSKKIPLFSLFGFKVGIDLTWLVLAVLITWSLAKGLFPSYFEDYSNTTYWWMGVAGALGLFASIIFHEFCHSIVAHRFGLPIKGITLFIFGGVAEMSEEPESPQGRISHGRNGSRLKCSPGIFNSGRRVCWRESGPAGPGNRSNEVLNMA